MVVRKKSAENIFITALAIGLMVRTLFSPNDAFAQTILFPRGGGLGTSTPPLFGQIPVGNSSGTYTLTGTSSLGLVSSVGLTVPTGLSVTGSPVTSSGTLAISLASGYNIPLTASTTNWNDFYNAPSNRITAGTNLSWSGNTLNATGGGGTPGGADGDLQINNSGAFGTIAGLNLDKTGNARGAGSLDIQSCRYINTSVASGCLSTAFGIGNTANAQYSNALGLFNFASGYLGAGIGNNNTASGYQGSALGNYNTASGCDSSASGYLNHATNFRASAVGAKNTASGYQSSASGYGNNASGQNASAFGWASNASGCQSQAFGFENGVSGSNSVALGSLNNTYNDCASGVGIGNIACGVSSNAFGFYNTAVSCQSSAFGVYNTACCPASSAIGAGSSALDSYSSALGYSDFACTCYSSAVGASNYAIGKKSNAFGFGNTAIEDNSSGVGFTNCAGNCLSSAFGACNFAGGSFSCTTYQNLSPLSYGDCSHVYLYGNFTSYLVGNNNDFCINGTPVGYSCTASGYNPPYTYVNFSSGDYTGCYGSLQFTDTVTVPYCGGSAFGYNNCACNNRASSFGYGNITTGDHSSAFGFGNTASAYLSTSLGSNISNCTANSVEIGPDNTEKLSISAYGVCFNLASGQGLYMNGGNINNAGNVSANYFYGDGSNIYNINIATALNNIPSPFLAGCGNTASGYQDSVVGYDNTICACGESRVNVFGDNNMDCGSFGLVAGYCNLNAGNNNLVAGYCNCTGAGVSNVTAVGQGNIAGAAISAAVGYYNLSQGIARIQNLS